MRTSKDEGWEGPLRRSKGSRFAKKNGGAGILLSEL